MDGEGGEDGKKEEKGKRREEKKKRKVIKIRFHNPSCEINLHPKPLNHLFLCT